MARLANMKGRQRGNGRERAEEVVVVPVVAVVVDGEEGELRRGRMGMDRRGRR